MEDEKILELYMARNEKALQVTTEKYGKYLLTIIRNIVGNEEDAEECFNDVLKATWTNIISVRPRDLKFYLVKLAKNISIDRTRMLRAEKRGGGSYDAALEEIENTISGKTIEEIFDEKEKRKLINAFMAQLSEEEQKIFVRRYWYGEKVKDISAKYDKSLAYVNMKLVRSRKKLKKYFQSLNVKDN